MIQYRIEGSPTSIGKSISSAIHPEHDWLVRERVIRNGVLPDASVEWKPQRYVRQGKWHLTKHGGHHQRNRRTQIDRRGYANGDIIDNASAIGCWQCSIVISPCRLHYDIRSRTCRNCSPSKHHALGTQTHIGDLTLCHRSRTALFPC